MIAILLGAILFVLITILILVGMVAKRILPNHEASAIILSAKLFSELQSENAAIPTNSNEDVKTKIKSFYPKNLN